MNKQRILYVDDDKENLRAFRRLFRKQYDVLLAESGQEGLQILQAHAPLPVIITDQRMPEMTGIEFLDHSIRISPESIRIIITGFTDVQALIDAINTGRVYRYITKPWDEQELYVTIKRAVESYNLQVKNRQLVKDLQHKNEELQQSYETLKQTQDKLIQSEKLASIGRLASRIAHELRNPIQGIRMGIDLLHQDIGDDPNSRDTLKHLDQEILAVNTIIQDLLEYARDMKFEYTATDVNSLLEGIVFNMSEALTTQGIDVKTHYEDLGTIQADGLRLRQVLLNLVQNAIDAMPTGGTLTLTTTAPDAHSVAIAVQDTGGGIAPEHRQRIFEPFFTTKDKGVGLGMSIVHKIIEAHGGSIQIDSQLDAGTTFTLILPRQREV
ncbi:response regulator [candidate division KSB3 bacterium]|uniref:histidine kinase n=1 Tax=candidate division KSB3 bacterium TaxID=2044937 RepID=A0A9D5Q7T8_9BACT|nr:response regulator [candidate division KSB3 bacterium]MBD3326788.1 response regulator [candidate division KSB3 bacterium]